MTRPKKTAVCPIGGVGVGGKWMFWIWYHLLGGTRRFGELRRLLPDASRQMLTIQLRELEAMGVLRRRVYDQQPPRVEYSLTELGRRSEPMLRSFYVWGHQFCEQAGLDYDEWLVRIGGRWTIWVWHHLLGGTRRFGDLQRLLPGVSRQALALELRELERMGVLQRQTSAQGSRRGDYALTELGQQCEPMLRALYAWGRWFCEQAGLEFDWPLSEEAGGGPQPTVRELSAMESYGHTRIAAPIGA